MESKVYSISSDLMLGSGDNLFGYIAECLAHFLKDRNLSHEILPLGFTFSFPCRQKGLDCGELIGWTKGFKCAGVEGRIDISINNFQYVLRLSLRPANVFIFQGMMLLRY